MDLDIYNTADYRDFLKARYWALKKSGKLSFQQFAKKHGTSISYLKLVLQRKRHIGLDKISAIALFLKLNENEKSYLTFSVLKAQSSDPSIREYFDYVLVSLKFNHDLEHEGSIPQANLAPNQRKSLFGRVLGMIIEQMIDWPDYRHQAEWIHARLSHQKRYSLDDVKTEMRLLEELGIIEKTGSKWKRATDLWRHTVAFSPDEYRAFAAGAAEASHAANHIMSSRPAYFDLSAQSFTDDEYETYCVLMQELTRKTMQLAKSNAPGKKIFISSFGLFCAARDD